MRAGCNINHAIILLGLYEVRYGDIHRYEIKETFLCFRSERLCAVCLLVKLVGCVGAE